MLPSRRLPSLLPALALTTLATACSSDRPALTLRPGFRVLAQTDGPPHRQLSGLGTQTEAVVLHDVSIAHGRIVLATVHGISASFPTWHPSADPGAPPTLSGVEAGQSGATLRISDDAGASWREVVPHTDDAALANLLAGGWLAVAEDRGHAAVMLPLLGSGVVVANLDLATGRLDQAIDGGFVGQLQRDGTRLSAADGYPRGFGARVFDFATGTDRRYAADWPPIGSPTDCGSRYYKLASNGQYTGICGRPDGSVCAMTVSVSNTDTNPAGWGVATLQLGSCMEGSDLPPIFGNGRDSALLAYNDRHATAFEADGHVWLLFFDSDPQAPGTLVARQIDLGPGGLDYPGWAGFQPRMEGFLPILDKPTFDDQGGAVGGRVLTRIVALPHAPGPGEDVANRAWLDLALPKTPCVDDAACHTTPVALRRMGDGQIFVVYSVSTEHNVAADAARQYLVVGTIPDPFWTPPEPPAPLEAGGPLEAQCARLASCFPGHAETSIDACLYDWRTVRADLGGADPVYDAFMAVPAGDCSAFYPHFPAALRTRATCETGCVGDIAVTCDGPDNVSLEDCRSDGVACVPGVPGADGPHCGTPDCASAFTRCDGDTAIQCGGPDVERDCAALGYTCAAVADYAGGPTSAHCVAPADDCEVLGRQCEGDRGRDGNCLADGRVDAGSRFDCGRQGLTCSTRNQCKPRGHSASCENQPPSCEGTRITYCLEGAPRYVDCATLGFSGCEMSDGLPACH